MNLIKPAYLIAVVCLLCSCATSKKSEVGSCCSSKPALKAVEISPDSIYQVTSIWQDQRGEKRALKGLAGRIQVITMGYSTCKAACPVLLADMRAIEAGLPEDVREKTGFTFVSIDPDTDTPARLLAYQKEQRITSERWTFLSGPSVSVQELAVVLGIQYRRVSEKDFAHSNLLTVLNAQGEIVHRQEGLAMDPAKSIEVITRTSTGR